MYMEHHNISEEYVSLDAGMRLVCAVTDGVASRSESEIHPHMDFIEIYRFVDGVDTFAYEGQRIAVTSGMIIAVCDNVLHRPLTRENSHYERQRLLIKKEVFSRYDTPTMELYARLRKRQILVLSPSDGGQRGAAFFDGIRELLLCKTVYDDYCALIRTLHLLIEMEADGASSKEELMLVGEGEGARILAYINEHLDEDLTYRHIAERFFLSEGSVYQLFRREIGFPLAQYVATRRIMRATAVLNAGGSATEAAAAAGFLEYSVFYRTFLRHVGMSPKAYIKSLSGRKYERFV